MILFWGLPLALVILGRPVRVRLLSYILPDPNLSAFGCPSAPSTGLTGATSDVPLEGVVVMTALQIGVSRELFGWLL